MVPPDPNPLPLDDPTTWLVREAKADRARFDELYRRIAPAVYAWASLKARPPLTRVLEPEDIVQEVWWRALESLGRYDPTRASFRTWIFGIANHVLLKSWRKVGNNPSVATGPTDPTLSQVPAEATAVSEAASQTEHLRKFLGLVTDLDRDDQLLIAHCGLEGLSASEASALLGASPDAVAKRWQRLRARLRDSMVGHELVV